MSTILLDTSILGRMANTNDVDHRVVVAAVNALIARGHTLCITPQNLVEFRNFATRPKLVNGLGLTAAEAASVSADFQARFDFLQETPAIHPAWQAVVDPLGILGKQVHDARLVAVCVVHAVSAILTFNVGHFTRLAAAVPGLAVLDSRTV